MKKYFQGSIFLDRSIISSIICILMHYNYMNWKVSLRQYLRNLRLLVAVGEDDTALHTTKKERRND